MSLISQTVHVGFEPFHCFGRKFRSQRPRNGPSQSSFPAGSLIVQVGPSARSLARGVNANPLGRTDDPDERSLGQNLPTTHARALRDMLSTACLLRRHLFHSSCETPHGGSTLDPRLPNLPRRHACDASSPTSHPSRDRIPRSAQASCLSSASSSSGQRRLRLHLLRRRPQRPQG